MINNAEKMVRDYEREFLDRLKEIFGIISKSEDSRYKAIIYLFLLDNISKEFRINWSLIGNQVARNLPRLEFSHPSINSIYFFNSIS